MLLQAAMPKQFPGRGCWPQPPPRLGAGRDSLQAPPSQSPHPHPHVHLLQEEQCLRPQAHPAVAGRRQPTTLFLQNHPSLHDNGSISITQMLLLIQSMNCVLDTIISTLNVLVDLNSHNYAMKDAMLLSAMLYTRKWSSSPLPLLLSWAHFPSLKEKWRCLLFLLEGKRNTSLIQKTVNW